MLGEVAHGAAAIAAHAGRVAHRQVVADGVADDVVQQQPVRGLLGEREVAQQVERGSRGRVEDGGQERLGDPADRGRRLHDRDGVLRQLPQERLEQAGVPHQTGLRAARIGAHRGRREHQRQRVAVGELARPAGLALVEAAQAQEFGRFALGQHLQRELGHEPCPACRRLPGHRRSISSGEHGERGGGQRGQEPRAQPGVEQAEHLVGVDHDDRPGRREGADERRRVGLRVPRPSACPKARRRPRGVGSTSRPSR